ncbi:hypothetical protein AL064_18040 [Pseudomonas syringae pv. syringae]|nr:hypothetical protein AL064_18040 [Pseudomonas syringae pv. syringae]KWS18790.1 hypothetical protein AL062_25290 [Pseudomonas syringae pv. syringae]
MLAAYGPALMIILTTCRRDDRFDESTARTYPKRIQRLAKEDCHLQGAFDDVAQLLTDSLGR